MLAALALHVACGGCPSSVPTASAPASSPTTDSVPTQQRPTDPTQQADTGPPQQNETLQESVDRRCPRKSFTRLVENAEACPAGAWVGETDAATCPRAEPGWTVTAVFPSGGGALSPVQRAPFCAYEWNGAGQPDPCGLPDDRTTNKAAGEWLERDCRVVAPAGGLPEILAGYANDRFARGLTHVEVPDAKVLPLLGADTGHQIALVAIVDTIEDEVPAPVPEWAFHGLAVQGLARAVACQRDPKACLARFLRVQALKPGPDPSSAAAFAYQGIGLAKAIRAATQQLMRRSGDDHGLPGKVMNLSLGWDPSYTWVDGTAAADGLERVSVRLVRAALVEASCAGVLVFAAAGNPAGGRAPAGPIYPAAWERVPAPGKDQCDCLRTCDSRKACTRCDELAASPDESLIQAVGMVGDADEELLGARAKGMPRLAAPGFFQATPMPDSDSFEISDSSPLRLPLMTGSSMSTAVLSAIAASVWSVNPKLPRRDVVRALYSSGETLPIDADFCLSGTSGCGATHRASFCRSVVAAGGFATAGDAAQAFASACTAARQPAGEAPQAEESLDTARDAVEELPTRIDSNYDPATEPAAGEEPPDDLPAGAFVQPWVIAPQPSRVPCSVCTLTSRASTSKSTLTLLTADWLTDALNVRGSTLEVVTAGGETRTLSLQRALGTAALQPGQTYVVSDLDVTAATAATMYWQATENGVTVTMTTPLQTSAR
ncbi:MAG: S8/S53 family peptidase [Deltaproteobacteria bacterium]|nr:S8/S53 family peptidase [Deltaproteobacteria bacterium]